MCDPDDYESLPGTTSLSTHMAAGAAAGIMEHCVMYPVDCVKTRMQVLVPDPRADYRNVVHAFVRIMQHEGLHMTIRGINTTVYGAGPAHALYFACYEKIKAVLSRANHSNHIAHGVAGCCATVLHDAVMTPTDVVKQRMQVYNSPYKSCLDCIRTVQRTEGIHAFYRSYWTQLLMNIPFVSLHFIVYESMQDTINPGRHYNPRTHVLSGAMAGAVAAAVTTPLDVCKTLLNTQSIRPAHGTAVITGLLHAFATVYRVRGMRGYFSGMTARVLFQAPSTAISWSVYEFFKFIITTRGHHHGEGKSTGGAITASVVVPVGVAASTD